MGETMLASKATQKPETGFSIVFEPHKSVWIAMDAKDAPVMGREKVLGLIKKELGYGSRLLDCCFCERRLISGSDYVAKQLEWPQGFVLPFDLLVKNLR